MGTSALKSVQDEKTEHLMWFVEHGFHQMKERRQAAKDELKKRGVNTKALKHQCICHQCKAKV